MDIGRGGERARSCSRKERHKKGVFCCFLCGFLEAEGRRRGGIGGGEAIKKTDEERRISKRKGTEERENE